MACPPTFHKTNMLHNNLKKDAINEFGIKYWTTNPVWVIFQDMGTSFTWILKKKYVYWLKKYWLEKTDKVTKTSLFDRNWAISLKPRRKSRPLRARGVSVLSKTGKVEKTLISNALKKIGSFSECYSCALTSAKYECI
jgi:hypothetical protein